MNDERGMATILNDLGVLYNARAEREKAAYYFLRSLKIVEKVDDKLNAATTMYELALLYEGMEESKKRLNCWKGWSRFVNKWEIRIRE